MLVGAAGSRRRASTVRITSPLAIPTRLQCFRTGGLDGGQPVIEHGAQHLDELSVPVGVLLQLGSDLGQGGRQIPVLERGAVAQGAGLPDQNRQIMPGIVDDLIAPEVARMTSLRMSPMVA